MRTKHLFYTMALAGIFAACTNDEFLEYGAPQATIEGQERPTISDVTLTVGEADTRASWNGGFTFENGDVISALLMDENNTGVRYGITTNTDEWNKLTWLEKYHLVDYVHTNFPFKYENGSFASDCNMLEGNYFLTYPYVCLDGNRQGRIDIAQQVQYGDEENDRKETVAKNQRFIGYAQLKAGEGSSDFKATLVPILAPVRLSIQKSNADPDLHITKVVVRHPKLSGTLMIDPTRAPYGCEKFNWNLNQKYVLGHTDAVGGTEDKTDKWHFNYANYLANQTATAVSNEGTAVDWKKELYYNQRYGSVLKSDYVYNAKEVGSVDEERVERMKKSETYYWDDAIRAAVQPMKEFNNTEYATQYVELYLKEGYYDENGEAVTTQEYMTLKNGESIEAIIMLPPFVGNEDPILLSIYTQEGIIKDLDLSKMHQGGGDTSTSGVGDRFDPTDKLIQRIEIKIPDNAIQDYPTDVIINNENDLLEWVKWLDADDENTGNKHPVAQFTNDIIIDDELAAAIEALDRNIVLSIISKAETGNNLKIATTTNHANILEHMDVASNVTVEVVNGGVLNITKNSYNISHEINSGEQGNRFGKLFIEVAEGGTLNINGNDRYGTDDNNIINFQPAANYTEVSVKNAGTINVNDSQLQGFFITNDGEINVTENASITFADYKGERSTNTIRGTINVQNGGSMSGTTNLYFENYGTIDNSGKITNILNLANKDFGKKPGIINIKDINAITTLSENTGVVNYGKLLAGVVLNEVSGHVMQNTGEYIYEGPATSGMVNSSTNNLVEGIQLSDLNKAHVTIAKITADTLFTDMESETTLKKLILKDGAAVAGNIVRDKTNSSKVTEVQHQLVFKKADTDGRYKGGSIVFEAGSAAKNVDFYNLADKEKSVLVTGSGKDTENVTFIGEKVDYLDGKTLVEVYTYCRVAFYKGVKPDGYISMWFESANVALTSGTKVYAESLECVDNTSSTIDNSVGSIYLKDVNVPYNVTVDGVDPILF